MQLGKFSKSYLLTCHSVPTFYSPCSWVFPRTNCRPCIMHLNLLWICLASQTHHHLQPTNATILDGKKSFLRQKYSDRALYYDTISREGYKGVINNLRANEPAAASVSPVDTSKSHRRDPRTRPSTPKFTASSMLTAVRRQRERCSQTHSGPSRRRESGITAEVAIPPAADGLVST